MTHVHQATAPYAHPRTGMGMNRSSAESAPISPSDPVWAIEHIADALWMEVDTAG